MRCALGVAAAFGVLVASPTLAAAHPLAPAGFTLTLEPEGAQLRARVPRRVRVGERPQLRFPRDCRETLEGERLVGGWIERELQIRCAEPLAGRPLTLTGVVPGGTTGLVRVERGDETREWLLDADAPEARVPGGDRNGEGIGHAGWAWACGEPSTSRPGSITSFFWSVSCSCSDFAGGCSGRSSPSRSGTRSRWCSAATYELTPPPAVVEPAILATLVLVGLELPEGRHSLVARRPLLVPLLVGLVHGGGFAGVLQSLGGGPRALAGALVPFHLGLEAAQLAVVALLALSRPLGRRLRSRVSPVMTGRLLGAVAFALLLARTLP